MKKRNTYILFILIILGFSYSLYLSLYPSPIKQEKTLQEKIEETQEFINLAPHVLDMNNDTVKSYLETKKAYNEFLKKSDTIIQDSLDCNCPNKTK